MPRAFYIPNHSSSDLHSAEVHDLPTLSKRPDFATKDDFVKWCHAISTDHVFYTLYEPEQPALRSSAENPIRLMHGLVADYDGAASAIDAALPTLKFAAGLAPAWVTTTFSGRARLIWMFEHPVPVFSGEVLARVLRSMAKELGMTKILPGLDEGFFTNPATPYELGTNWRQPFGDQRVPATMVMTHVHDASNKVKWKSDTVDIPMEAIEAEVNKRWPGRWSGPFVEGARGIRFWDPKADNLTGVTIRAQGVQAWTGEGKFLPWSEVLGNEFVKKYRQSRIGGAIEGTYFDGREYWQKDGEGVWQNLSAEMVKRRLNLSGLSCESRRGQGSEVARALTSIEDLRRVDGTFPCHFVKEEVVRHGPGKFLNVSRAKLVTGTPLARGVRGWGEGCPWIARYLDGLFDPHQLDVFLSWFAHFYQTSASGKPRGGHALFVAGPPSSGKTLLSQRVIGGIMGGFQEATSYVLGETTFNEQLVHSPVWTVDDAVATSDPRSHARYSQIVKKAVANPTQEFSAKFKKTSSMPLNFRLVVTFNTDEDSVEMLPATDNTILDKLVVLLARKPELDFSNANDVIAHELPSFADYLCRYVIPSGLQTRRDETVRFGFDAYFHPELLATAADASSAAGLREILEMWRIHYFRRFSEKSEWRGTATDLLLEFQMTEEVSGLSKSVTRGSYAVLGKDLKKLIKQGVPWIVKLERKAGARLYKILAPDENRAQRGGSSKWPT